MKEAMYLLYYGIARKKSAIMPSYSSKEVAEVVSPSSRAREAIGEAKAVKKEANEFPKGLFY